MSEDLADWAAGRREAASEHARRLSERKRLESQRAQALIDAFIAVAASDGVPPEPLVVKGRPKGRARTSLLGWYLKTDHTAAVATDGKFYVLTADLTMLDRVRGVKPIPSDPPLIVGEGGGDGETIDMSAALERHLKR